MGNQPLDRRWAAITSVVVIATIVIVVAYDVLTFHMGGPGTTVSAICYRFMRAHPGMAFAAGMLLGHLTWANRRVDTSQVFEAWMLLVFAAVLVVTDLLHVLRPINPIVPFLVGVPMGHIVFGQNISPLQRAVRALRR